MADLNKRQIVVIAPSQQSLDIYDSYIVKHKQKDFVVRPFFSFQDFSKEMATSPHYAGFIVDMRSIIKADPGDKEFFYYLIESFPVIRISHTIDQDIVKGNIRGKTLQGDELFDYFFEAVFQAPRPNKQIILFSVNPESQKLYDDFLIRYPGITVHRFSKASQFKNTIGMNSRYSGFIIDLRTMMRANADDKDFFNELIDSFPAIRISHSIDRKDVKGNIRNKNLTNKELFDFFLDDLCHYFEPRGIRTGNRKRTYLNVELFLSESGNKPLRANTVDISENGCFIATPATITKNDTIKIVIKEFNDPRPILCTAKWLIAWGESSRHLPGVGVRIDALTPGQKEELTDLLNKPF
ncbi:MAG: PilZ domain-containing protein [bacterium]|nr:PilZ domain-containing protein [bacterium]